MMILSLESPNESTRLRVRAVTRLLVDVRRGRAGRDRQDYAESERQRQRDQQRGRGARRAAASCAALCVASPIAEAPFNQRHAGFLRSVGTVEASVTPLLNSYRVDSKSYPGDYFQSAGFP